MSMRITKTFKFDAKEVEKSVATIEKNAAEREATTKAFSVDAMQIAAAGKVDEFQNALRQYNTAQAHFDSLDQNAAGYLIRLIQYLGSDHLSPSALANIVKGTSVAGKYDLSVQRANKTLQKRRADAKDAAERKKNEAK